MMNEKLPDPKLQTPMQMRPSMQILIVDDCAQTRRGLRALVATILPEAQSDSSSGAEWLGEAEHGAEALQQVEAHRPMMVIMDAQMPVMNGIEATRAIKMLWPEIKVIMLTLQTGYRDAALTAGADAFLLKGGSTGTLLETISDFIQQGVHDS